MAEFTPNYGLHQWAPDDNFLRTDFNQDFSIIDTALGRLARGAEDSAYNLYNLMLQNDYEGKYTGYKKALLFDGFQDESGIAEKDASIVVRGNSLHLGNTPQGDQAFSYETEHRVDSGSTALLTATGNGHLHTLTLYTRRNSDAEEQHIVHYTAYRNNEVMEQGQFQVTSQNALTTQQLSLQTPFSVEKGDQVYFYLSVTDDYSLYCTGLKDDHLACIYHFNAATGTQGSVTTTAVQTPDWERVLAWVRHSGGDVALALLREDGEAPMPLVSAQAAQTLDGQACVESAFRLDGPGTGEISLRLELTRREEDMRVYDYGLVWI